MSRAAVERRWSRLVSQSALWTLVKRGSSDSLISLGLFTAHKFWVSLLLKWIVALERRTVGFLHIIVYQENKGVI